MDSKHSPAVPVNRTRTAEDTPPGGGTAAAAAPSAAPPPASPPAMLSGTPTSRRLLAAFRHRWRLAAGLGLLVSAAAVFTCSLTSPPSYTAYAFVQVNRNNPLLNLRPGPRGRVIPDSSSAGLTRWLAEVIVSLTTPDHRQDACS
jgi:hypothetical protein